jgi:hypothetical protein
MEASGAQLARAFPQPIESVKAARSVNFDMKLWIFG